MCPSPKTRWGIVKGGVPASPLTSPAGNEAVYVHIIRHNPKGLCRCMVAGGGHSVAGHLHYINRPKAGINTHNSQNKQSSLHTCLDCKSSIPDQNADRRKGSRAYGGFPLRTSTCVLVVVAIFVRLNMCRGACDEKQVKARTDRPDDRNYRQQ